MKPSLIEVVQHYKKKIERNSDEQKILHCFDKLMLLPITLDILSETGVGKTVNAFRRDQGVVGARSRELVAKWKRIFEESELARAPEPEESSGSEEDSACEEGCMQIDDSVRYQDVQKQYSDTGDSISGSSRISESRLRDSHESRISSKDRNHRHEDRGVDPPIEQRYAAIGSKREESPELRCSRLSAEPQQSSSSERKKSRSKDGKSSHNSHDRRLSPGSVERDENTASSSSAKRPRDEASSADISQSSKTSKKSSSHGTSADSDKKHRKHHSSKSHERKSEKKKKRESSRCESSRERSSPSGESSVRSAVNHSPTGGPASESQGVSIARSDKSEGTPRKKAVTNGSSFSDVLGGVDASIGKKKKKSKSSSERKKSTASASRETPSDTISRSSFTGEPPVSGVAAPSFEPGPDAGRPASVTPADLPEISAIYRPLPRPVHSESRPVAPSKRVADEQEALSAVLAAKNKRTKIYSGSKVYSWTKVPTLVDICLRSLQENIDYLEYTGGVPFEILRPVLERCTAEQLHSIEYYNAYLTEDTAPLWENYVRKEFRNATRQEYESWKEMYMRCCEEREAKLEKLRTTIEGKRQDHLANSRKTKVAFVNSVVKPPRNVARKQAKNGTAVTGASTGAPAVSRALRPAPGSDPTVRATPHRSTAAPPKRKAPLMAKVLRSIGGRR